MLGGIWSFLQDENNRAVLTWIGGGIAVVIGAVWAVLKFFFAQKSVQKGVPGPTVMATHGGIAAGRDISTRKIDTCGGAKR